VITEVWVVADQSDEVVRRLESLDEAPRKPTCGALRVLQVKEVADEVPTAFPYFTRTWLVVSSSWIWKFISALPEK
jgi:hypothetical protein